MTDIKTFPNQKIVKIHKAQCDKTHLYSVINLDAMRGAMKAFNGREANAFLLWCYFAMNQQDYEFALSNKAVEEAIGVKKDAYDSAIAKLIKAGYLVNDGGNRYSFYEEPPEGQRDGTKEA